jgi:glucan-binding YG repeat protein
MIESPRFKLFKKGKNWCIGMVAAVSMLVGIATATTTTQADEVSSQSSEEVQNFDKNNVNTIQGSDVALVSSSDRTQTNTNLNDNDKLNYTTESDTDNTNNETKQSVLIDDNPVSNNDSSKESLDAKNLKNDVTSTTDNSVVDYASDATSESNAVDTNSIIYKSATAATVESSEKNGLALQGGKTYLYQDGQKLSGTQVVDGKTYFFDESTFQMKTNFFNVDDGKVYYFGSNGQMFQDQFYSNWGNVYYFGVDGARYTDKFYTNWGNKYYFGDNGARFDDQFYTNKDKVYYFSNDGTMYQDKFYSNWGNVYYFGNDGVRYTNQFYTNWGNVYYFGDNGARYTNQFYSNWGNQYYFGNDGARYTNKYYVNCGNIYYFDGNGALTRNQNANLGSGYLNYDGNGVLSYYNNHLQAYQNAFLNKVLYGAIIEWVNHKILPALTASQAIIESGWGTSSLSANYNNLFGIKGSYNGHSVTLPTGEYYGGSYVTVNAAFRAYDSYAQSIGDHSAFLTSNSRYSNLIGQTNSNTVATLIRQDGYATSPTYTSTLINTMNAYDLYSWNTVGFSI